MWIPLILFRVESRELCWKRKKMDEKKKVRRGTTIFAPPIFFAN